MYSNITIVSVTGHQDFAIGSLKAIIASQKKLPGAQGLLHTPDPVNNLPTQVEWVKLKPFGYQEYSFFMIYALRHFIKTDYIITVQDDGWILDSNQWKDEFLDYDYIGAPIHLARVVLNGKVEFMRGFRWVEYIQNPAANITFVQNGGFTLRSRRLLERPSTLKIPFTTPGPSNILGNPPAMFWDTDEHFEDVQLSITMREPLEASGIKFAPLDIAKRFSIEHAGGFGLHSKTDIQNVFGHHSKLRKISSENQIDYQIPYAQLGHIHGETEISQMLQSKGYQLNFMPDKDPSY